MVKKIYLLSFFTILTSLRFVRRFRKRSLIMFISLSELNPILAPVLSTSSINFLSSVVAYQNQMALDALLQQFQQLHLCCVPSITSLSSLSWKLSSILHYYWLLDSQVYAHLKASLSYSTLRSCLCNTLYLTLILFLKNIVQWYLWKFLVSSWKHLCLYHQHP